MEQDPIDKNQEIPYKKGMKFPSFLKKKRTYVILVLVAGGVIWWLSRGPADPSSLYETAVVERGTLERTVEVTGEMSPAQRIALSFERGGSLGGVFVSVGEKVHAGDILAELGETELTFTARRAEASLHVAQANLNLKLAGETDQAIRVSEADVEKARASESKARVDASVAHVNGANDVKTAELALATAQLDQLHGDATDAQDVDDAEADLRTALLSALGPLQTSLADGDAIIGVDDTATNSSYKILLGIGDSAAKTRAETSYQAAKTAKSVADERARGVTVDSDAPTIDDASAAVVTALDKSQAFLSDVQKVLAASISGPSLSSTELAAKKSQIDGDRTAISTQKAAVENAHQAVVQARLDLDAGRVSRANTVQTSRIKVEIARTTADAAIQTADANLVIAQASLAAAEAALELKKVGPRDVDTAPLRAALAEAEAAAEQARRDLAKTRIVAPVDGVVAEIIPEPGEQIAAGSPAVRLVGAGAYDIEILLPESDVAKVEPGQKAVVTLDAYGDGVEFSGTVVSEEPDQTLVQDAVYYKARIQVSPPSDGSAEFKPGMTANVTIETARTENTLILPARAVRTDLQTRVQTVRVLQDGQPVERTIKTGLRGDEGRIEITEGLKEGETVIVSERAS